MASFKPEVQTDDSGQWYGNALRFATRQEAEDNARDLMDRWFAVRAYRASLSEDSVNYQYVSGPIDHRGFHTMQLIAIDKKETTHDNDIR
jgi:hypothetical protein